MGKLSIDYKKHLGYSKTAEKGIRKRLAQKYGAEECARIMEQIDRKYEDFLADLPYCGGKHNLMIWQLYDAIAAFAYWEVLPEKETVEEFYESTGVIFGKDVPEKKLPHFLTVDSKGFLRLARALIRRIGTRMNRELDTGRWEDGWRIEMDTDGLKEGIQVALVGCPIYNFAVKHGYEFLMPAMCNWDFPGIDMIHGGLIRPRTVSNGDDRCDNWYVSMDSERLEEYPPEQKENGLLISRDWRK